MTLGVWPNLAYKAQLWFMITWGPITSSIFIRTHYHCIIYHYSFQRCVILHCQWLSCTKILRVFMVVPLLALAIAPHGICSNHRYHQCYIFLITWPKQQGLLNCDLQWCRILHGSCPHSKLAAFHVTQYIGDSINSRVESSTSVTQRGTLSLIYGRRCEMEWFSFPLERMSWNVSEYWTPKYLTNVVSHLNFIEFMFHLLEYIYTPHC